MGLHIVFVSDPPVGQSDQNVGGTHGVIGNYRDELLKLGHKVTILSGTLFGEVPQNRSAYSYLTEVLDGLDFDQVHLVTQGRLGLLARRYCRAHGIPFTTAYHTQIPEYLEVRHGVPAWVGYLYMRWFLNGADKVIVPTPSMAERLRERGVENTVALSHGVNTERFQPAAQPFLQLPGPIAMYVGRVSPEKNPEAFLDMQFPGTKVVVGGASGGLNLDDLRQKYADVHFVGVQSGDELARYFSAANVFVFPSRSDTFGLVLLEALASGVPVAAYPVTGPVDVITDPRVGCLNEDLGQAAVDALELSAVDCRNFALQRSWTEATRQFLALQSPCAKPAKKQDWFERKIASLPQRWLSNLVGKVEAILFAAEPAGPYSGPAKA